MSFIARQEPFRCEHCHASVTVLESGTYRNHCPLCLYSKHVDDKGPGDRESRCLGLQKPIGIDQHTKKGFVILYECEKCKKISRNRAAPDDLISIFVQEHAQR